MPPDFLDVDDASVTDLASITRDDDFKLGVVATFGGEPDDAAVYQMSQMSLCDDNAEAVPAPQDACGNNAMPGSTASERKDFLVFAKVLFTCIDRTRPEHFKLRAKKIVAECTKRNRLGDPMYSPLVGAVERDLRPFVGDALWMKSFSLFSQLKERMASSCVNV